MKVIVGLGNPGLKYAGTRHNVGFEVIDYLAAAPGCSPFREKFEAFVAEMKEGDETVLLVKPLTFMNLSGRAVRAILDFYKLPVETAAGRLRRLQPAARQAADSRRRAATAGRTGCGTFRSSSAPTPTPDCESGSASRARRRGGSRAVEVQARRAKGGRGRDRDRRAGRADVDSPGHRSGDEQVQRRRRPASRRRNAKKDKAKSRRTEARSRIPKPVRLS